MTGEAPPGPGLVVGLVGIGRGWEQGGVEGLVVKGGGVENVFILQAAPSPTTLHHPTTHLVLFVHLLEQLHLAPAVVVQELVHVVELTVRLAMGLRSRLVVVSSDKRFPPCSHPAIHPLVRSLTRLPWTGCASGSNPTVLADTGSPPALPQRRTRPAPPPKAAPRRHPRPLRRPAAPRRSCR
jgi:hypothetical protein